MLHLLEGAMGGGRTVVMKHSSAVDLFSRVYLAILQQTSTLPLEEIERPRLDAFMTPMA